MMMVRTDTKTRMEEDISMTEESMAFTETDMVQRCLEDALTTNTLITKTGPVEHNTMGMYD